MSAIVTGLNSECGATTANSVAISRWGEVGRVTTDGSRAATTIGAGNWNDEEALSAVAVRRSRVELSEGGSEFTGGGGAAGGTGAG
jgi:hypothetical protein